MDELADTVDQNVSIMNGCQAVCGWFNFHPVVAMVIATCSEVWFCRQAENGMLHAGHIAFGSRIDDIADEEVRCRVPVW